MAGLMRDPYYNREEVSNSDLTALMKYWMPEDQKYDIEKAYRFGTLLDNMVTEKFKVNFFKLTCDGEKYSRDEFMLAEEMAKEFWKDPFCRHLASNSLMQSICIKNDFEIQYESFIFWLSARLKFDLDARERLKMAGDLKSTTATTLKQFIDACDYFQYWRQAAWYMSISEVDKFMIIGISKVNRKIFKVPIVRGEEFFNKGKSQYEELAWKYHYLFGDIEKTKIIELLPQMQEAI